MVDAVQQHEIPQHIADRLRVAGEEVDRSVEIGRLQLLDARNGIAVDALEARRQFLDFFRALESRRPRIAGESSALDREASVRFRFGEMPGQLAERAAVRIGAEVITAARQRLEQLDGFRGFAFPGLLEKIELVFYRTSPPPNALYNETADTATRV